MNRVLVFAMLAVVIGWGQESNGQTPPNHEELRIAVQQICPVSGNKLGEHGKPIKIKVGEEMVYLCCQGCLKGKIDKQHWATIHANMAKAQGKCPVMKKALPKNPKWTMVNGQIVYVCCPPCTKKIAADPKTFLKTVDTYYAAWLKAKTSPRKG